MSKPVELLCSVAFRHLSTDAKRAGATLPDAQLHYLSLKQIRTLLESAAALAPDVPHPSEPELRITGSTGKFVVQLKAGKLHFISWASSVKAGGVITPAQIIDAISGIEPESHRGAGHVGALVSRTFGSLPSMNMGLLVVAIIAVNSFTFWFLTRPPRTLTPKFTLLQPEPAERLLTDVAGVYETGDGPGDRRLEIQKNGGMQRIKFGTQRTVTQTQAYTVKAAEAAGKPALVTNKQTVITITDMQAVVLYGDTYRRVNR